MSRTSLNVAAPTYRSLAPTPPLAPNGGMVIATARQLDVERLTGSIGAIVSGLDLSAPLPGRDVAQLRALIAEHQVVFIRDQPLDEQQLEALAAHFGSLSIHPVSHLRGSMRSVSTIDDTSERPPAGFDWHTDLSWTVEPPELGFLAAVTIPPYGGDTLWVSGRAIYERRDPDQQRYCRTLRVVHQPDRSLLDSVRRHHGDEVVERLLADHPPIDQPLVRLHPLTGRPAMWLSPLYATGIVGLDDAESRRVLRSLHRQIDEPEVQVRWRWKEGDVAIWDETSTCHRALTDHAPQRRTMRRCTTAGGRPIAADA